MTNDYRLQRKKILNENQLTYYHKIKKILLHKKIEKTNIPLTIEYNPPFPIKLNLFNASFFIKQEKLAKKDAK